MQKTRICLVGIGPGNPELLTAKAAQAIAQSDCLIGAKRMLESFPDFVGERFCSIVPEEIRLYLKGKANNRQVAILLSGDPGFYSAAKSLRIALADFPLESFCGMSSLQYFCARLGTDWEETKAVSAHGREVNLSALVQHYPKVFLLTGGKLTVQRICERISTDGFGEAIVSVGENLSYPNERLSIGTAKAFAKQEFCPLSVMLIQNKKKAAPPWVTHGLEDEAFLRNLTTAPKVPMTKSEVRAVSLSKLRLRAEDIVYDIGAGTGSVAVEMALRVWGGRVYAVEKNEDALLLLAENKARFSAWNLELVPGTAPEVLQTLPAPDRVFIGGSSGNLEEILACLLRKNPAVRVVMNAITLETVSAAIRCFEQFEMKEIEVVQLSVSKAKLIGTSHLMQGQNPVTIFCAQGKGAALA